MPSFFHFMVIKSVSFQCIISLSFFLFPPISMVSASIIRVLGISAYFHLSQCGDPQICNIFVFFLSSVSMLSMLSSFSYFSMFSFGSVRAFSNFLRPSDARPLDLMPDSAVSYTFFLLLLF